MERLRQALGVRHCRPRTEQAYCRWVKRLIYFQSIRHPAQMAEAEINAFLTHLAVRERVSAPTRNQALSALLFLYRRDIGHEVGDLGKVIRARKPTRLPVVMTREEVKAAYVIVGLIIKLKTQYFTRMNSTYYEFINKIYTHVLNRGPSGVRSPLEGL